MPSSSTHATAIEQTILRLAKISNIQLRCGLLMVEARRLGYLFAELLDVDYNLLRRELEPRWPSPGSSISPQQHAKISRDIDFHNKVVQATNSLKRSDRIWEAAGNLSVVSDLLQQMGRFQEAYNWAILGDDLRVLANRVLAEDEREWQARQRRGYGTYPIVISDSEDDEGVVLGRL